METKKTVAEIVTEHFIKGLERTGKWMQPWKGGIQPQNLVHKKPYNGINWLLCTMNAERFTSPFYLTEKQIKDMGGRYNGEATLLTFWKMLKFDKKNAKTNADEEKTIPYMRFYKAFNIEQVTGIDFTKFITAEERAAIEGGRSIEPNEAFKAIMDGWKDKPAIIHHGARACYIPRADEIHMPPADIFNTTAGYAATLAHESIHATGHANRVNRDLTGSFDRESYSFEELIAEIGSCMLMSEVGYFDAVKENSVAYVNTWVARLKEHPKMILQAATKAEKAVQWIKGIHKDQLEVKD